MSDVQTEQQVETGQQQTETQQVEPQTEQRQQPDTSWVPKRISEITAARRAAEQRAAEAEARLRDQEALIAQLRSGDPAAATRTTAPPPSPEEFDRLVNARADAIVNQRASESTLNQRIAEVNAAGAKDFGEDYEKSVNNLNMAGIGGPDFLRVVTNVPNPEKLVTWLGKPENLNEAMRVATLDPVQMAIEMTKMSTRAAKDLGKQISKVPAPVEGLEGGSSVSDGGMPDPEKDPKGFIAWRNKNARKKR
jgi:hypothetical protein